MRFLLFLSIICLAPTLTLASLKQPVKVRPRIMGESMPLLEVQDDVGKKVLLHTHTSGRFSIVLFAGTHVIHDDAQEKYYKALAPYFKQLGYNIYVIFPFSAAHPALKELKAMAGTKVFFDPGKKAFAAIGLADSATEQSPTLNGVFIVGPDEVIRFQNATINDSTPLSGEILVFAAKQYRDLYKKNEEAKSE